MDSNLMKKLAALTELNEQQEKVKAINKKTKLTGERVIIFKSSERKLGCVIPGTMKIGTLNKFTDKNREDIEEFRNNDEKYLRL